MQTYKYVGISHIHKHQFKIHSMCSISTISGSGRSPGEGHGNPLLYFCLESPMDRRAWKATVHSVAKSQTQLKQTQQANNQVYINTYRSLVCVRAQSLQLCLTLWDPTECNPLGSSVHGILQAIILEWVAIFSSRGSSRPRDRTSVSYASCNSRWVLHHQTTWEAHWSLGLF